MKEDLLKRFVREHSLRWCWVGCKHTDYQSVFLYVPYTKLDEFARIINANEDDFDFPSGIRCKLFANECLLMMDNNEMFELGNIFPRIENKNECFYGIDKE